MLTARVFRLFVSSTFSDFIAEREALRTRVFPELERFCAARGARFEAIDLRWGITEDAQRDHDTMRICLEEVRRCQQLSPRPNFAVLLGDRYGWEPVPARIPRDHWRRLRAAAVADDWALIERSYRLDLNAVPPVYCLKPRKAPRVAARHESRLLAALRRAARSFRGAARLPYFASATHQEIALGALTGRDEAGRALHPEQHVQVYVRRLGGLPEDASAREFIDWDGAADAPVPGARDRLRGLERDLRLRLGRNVHEFHIAWARHGRGGAVNQPYLSRFCAAFLAHQRALIETELPDLEDADESQEHDRAHRRFGAERARVFAGRTTVLTKIERYVTGVTGGRAPSLAAPLILVGDGGSGKSALLARAAQDSRKSRLMRDAVMFQRYIGGVPGSESLMSTLIALITDISRAYDRPAPPVPEGAKALAGAFVAALSHANARKPLIVYLDALDQFDATDSAWMLEWLPKELPRHARLVASVRTGVVAEQSARRRFPESVVELAPMKPAEGRAMLDAWLADKRSAWFNAGVAPGHGRRLTAPQRHAVLQGFAANGSPLWLKLAYEDAAAWASWHKPRRSPVTVHGIITEFVERKLLGGESHPRRFTERALAYLTAGRFGLSEKELGRALATDVDVRAEFAANERTQRKWEDHSSLPPILWSRLFFDLEPYLGLSVTDGSLLMRWFHREFGEVMRERYLSTTEDRGSIHGALAGVFHDLERELRPNDLNDDGLFRATDVAGRQVSAALRRVMEQPWQLVKAGAGEKCRDILGDISFVIAKCAANRSDDLVQDCLALTAEENDTSPDRRSLVAMVLSNGNLLRRGDAGWPAHRILLQRGLDEVRNPVIQRLYQDWISKGLCDWGRVQVRHVADVMSGRDTAGPSPIMVMEGHHDAVRGAAVVPGGRLISWSLDGDIRIWDMASGHCLQLMPLSDRNVLDVKLYADRFAAAIYVDSPQCLIWDLQQGSRTAVLEGHTNAVTGCAWLREDRLLTWSEDGTARLWKTNQTPCQLDQLDMATPIGGASISTHDRVALWSESGRMTVWSWRGKRSTTIEAPDSSRINGALYLADGRLLYWTDGGFMAFADDATGETRSSFKTDLRKVTNAVEVAPGVIACWHEKITIEGSEEHFVEVWSLKEGVRHGVVGGHFSYLKGVTPAPHRQMVSYDNGGDVRVWSLDQHDVVVDCGGAGSIAAVEVATDGIAVVASADLRVYEVPSGRLIGIWDGYAGTTGIKILDGRNILSLHRDGLIRVFRLPRPEDARAIDGRRACTTDAHAAADRVFVSHEDGSVFVFDPVSGACVHQAKPHVGTVTRLTAGAGDLLMSIGDDGVVGAFDIHDGRHCWRWESKRPVLNAWQQSATTVMVWLFDEFRMLDAKTGRQMASVTNVDTRCDVRRASGDTDSQIFNFEDGRSELWSSSSGAVMYPLAGHDGAIADAVMVGRSIVVSASTDSTLRVWHHPSGRCVHVLRGHSAPVARIYDIGEGRIVSTCSQRNEKRDHEMRVWDVGSGGCISTLTGHRGSVAGVLILRSGGMLSWTRDGEFGLWSTKNFRRRWLRRQPWTSISEVVESANDDIVCCRGNGVAFTWNLRDGTIRTTSLRSRIDEDPALAEPEVLDRWAGVLSDGDMRAQWVDRHLVLRCGVRSPAVVWHSDNRGELVSVSRTGIVGVIDGNRLRFLDTLDGGSVEGGPGVIR